MSVLYFRNESGAFVPVPAIMGRSAYQLAVKDGFEGTEQEWLESLKGKDGLNGTTPVRGKDYWTEEDQQQVKDYVDEKTGGADVVGVSESRALTAEDAGRCLRVDAEAALTVPAGVFAVGIEIEVLRNTADAVTIVSGGVAFAVAGNEGLVTDSQSILLQYGSAVLKQIADDVWSIQGAV